MLHHNHDPTRTLPIFGLFLPCGPEYLKKKREKGKKEMEKEEKRKEKKRKEKGEEFVNAVLNAWSQRFGSRDICLRAELANHCKISLSNT